MAPVIPSEPLTGRPWAPEASQTMPETNSPTAQRLIDCLCDLGIASLASDCSASCTTAAQLEQAANAPAGDFNRQPRESFDVSGGYAITTDGQTLVNAPLALSYLAYGANGRGIPALRAAMVAATAERLKQALTGATRAPNRQPRP
jgi:hypothetical protein